MSEGISRRAFGATLLGSALTTGALAESEGQTPVIEEPRDYPKPKFEFKRKKPSLGTQLIQDFVIFAHSEFDNVKLVLEKYPAVLNATVDWGGGDFESALGGAAHMGRRDIAEYLLDKGARMDIFATAMLGNLDAVKSLLTAKPSLIDAKGPHGLPLIFHAKAGGEEAKRVLAFLESLKPQEF